MQVSKNRSRQKQNTTLQNTGIQENIYHLFIHSCYFYSASSSPLLLRGIPDTARILSPNFTPKALQLWVKDLPKVPMIVVARAGFEPATIRMKGIDSTNVPPSPTNK